MTTQWLIPIACASLAFAQHVERRQPRRIFGKVIDSVSSAPIIRAKVAISCISPRRYLVTQEVLTGLQGSFEFTEVPEPVEPGDSCGLLATRNGYLPLPTEHAVTAITEPQVLPLTPQSVITGTVFDERGQPMPFGQVRLFHPLVSEGLRTVAPSRNGSTDDQGRFRIAGLEADRYRVCVALSPSSYQRKNRLNYPETCLPAPPDSTGAEWIDLDVGESRDLRFQVKQVRTVNIAGLVTNPRPWMSLSLLRVGLDGRPEECGTARWDLATGRFEFLSVLPGKFLIDMRQGGADQLKAVKEVAVADSDIDGIELTLRPDPVLTVRFLADDDAPLPRQGIEVRMDQVRWHTQGNPIPVPPDGTLVTSLSAWDSYRLHVYIPGWYVKSATQDGRDILAGNLELRPDMTWGTVKVIASRPVGSVQGLVQPEPGGGVSRFLVRLMQWRGSGVDQVRVVPVIGYQGYTFEIGNIPPGKYFLLAWPQGAEVPYLEPDYLASYRQYRAEVEVVEGRSTRVELKPIPADSRTAAPIR